MTRPAAVARHPSAGRLEPVRLFLRYRELEPARSADAPPGERVAEGQLQPGSQAVGPFRVSVAVDAEGESATYEVSLSNAGSRPLRLEALCLGFCWQAPAPRSLSNLRFLRQGWQSWSFAGSRELDAQGEPRFPSGPWLRGFHHVLGTPPADRAGWHESDLVTAVGVSPRGPTCTAGVLETGRAFGVIFLRRETNEVRVEVEQRFECLVEPLVRIEAEAVRVALGEDAARLLETHAEIHGVRAGARTRAPFRSGWCSWYHFFHDITEEPFHRNLEALAAAREELPVEVVQLDDGYQRAVGDWTETNEKFPRGLASLSGAIRDAGFSAGLWTAPFCVVPESRVFAEQPDWLLRSGSDLLRGLHQPVWTREGWVFVLDPTREEVCDHLRRTFAALVGLGFSYLKLDFLYTAALEAEPRDSHLTRAARLRRGLDAIRAGAGEEAFLLGCGCPLGAAAGVVDGMRIGPDVAPAWEPLAAQRIPGLEPTLPAARNALRNTLARAWMHRRLWLNDPDCLLARSSETQLGPEEVHTLAVAIAATGGMAFLSDDVPGLPPECRARARETIELAREIDGVASRERARTPDLLGEDVASAVVVAMRSSALVALVNAGEARRVTAVDLLACGLHPDHAAPEPLLGSPRASDADPQRISVELPPHGSALYRVRAGPRLAVFCDFDGTFAVQDVGSTLARRYAGARRDDLWARLCHGELTAWEYNLELLDGLVLSESDLEDFLRTVELDPGARELVAWCAEHAVPFRVLSDGFDRNLDRLQQLHGVRFAYDANHLRYEGGAWRIEPGQPNPDCSCGTGTCKRARIDAFRADHPGVVVVHIGNGRVSDLCAAAAADVVFAKDSLAEALEEENVRFERFTTLHDVRAGLERLLEHLG